jgi:hypothetical protein
MSPPAATPVTSLDSLVAAHPDSLGELFAAGRATDPAELGDAPRGKVLAFAHGADVFLVFRPILRALASGFMPWRGKTFDHGGNSGQNVLVDRRAFRFQAEVAASQLDGRPALALTYDAAPHGNPWPVSALRDELRTVGPGVAIGPAFFLATGGSAPIALFWFGLENASRPG